MILDTGICTIYREADTSAPGDMPVKGYVIITSGWFGELSFETSPVWQTEGRKEQRADRKIRILQCRAIAQDDVVIVDHEGAYNDRPLGSVVYKIIRAYHGKDDDGPTLITDLTLEVISP